MDFLLNIGTLTKTIDDCINQYNALGELKNNRNNAVTALGEYGWSGEAKDSFLKAHDEKMKLYDKLEEDMQTMINILKDEKERALKLKQRSDGFINCIIRNGDLMPATEENSGIISLQYGGRFQINNHINNCTNEDYVRLTADFRNIETDLGELQYTSFGIGGQLWALKASVKDQTTSLTDFVNSFNKYCFDVKDLESYICLQFAKISGVSEGSFKSSYIISPSGDIDKNQLRGAMLKDPDDLTAEEKEKLEYIDKVLGEDGYNVLKDLLEKDPEDLSSIEKPILKNLKNIQDIEKLLDKNIDDLPEYDPLNAKIDVNKGTRIKKIGANGQYFGGTIDDLGNFIPDDNDAFIDDGYNAYKNQMNGYLKAQKTSTGETLNNWQKDVYNFRYGPMKYKLEALDDYFNDKWPVASVFSEMYKIDAKSKGMDPESTEIYGNLYGDYASGMMLEFGVTTGFAGLKSFINGFYKYDGVAGSGIGNISKTSYVKSSEISEKVIKNVQKKWGQKGIDAFEKAMNKGIVGPEGQNGIKQLKGKPIKGKYTYEIKVKNKEYGDYRIYGYKDSDGKMIFDYFDKGLH